jgi:transketolase
LGIEVNVVSMPCCELFDRQPEEYRRAVLGSVPRIAIEAGSTFGWHKYVGDNGAVLGIDSFGASGKGNEVYAHFGLTVENVVKTVQKFI